jgi:hypothetical protein
VAHVRLSEALDRFVWGLLQNSISFVNSMYTALITGTRVVHSSLWKLKKIFMWYLKREVVLTKDNLAR